MRKWRVAGFGAGVVGVLAALVAVNGGARAAKGDDDGPRSVQLPVTRVVLFSSGVGHFLREGRSMATRGLT